MSVRSPRSKPNPAGRSFSQSDFNQFILEQNVVGFFEKPVTLKSGRSSNWYVNWRSVTSDAYLLLRTVEFVLAFARDKKLSMNCFYGVPEGATKLAVVATMELARTSSQFSKGSHVIAMGRAQAKEHGDPKDRYFVGMPKGKCVILEDVTTTGGSLLSTIDHLMDSGVEAIAAVGLTNRMELRDDGASVEQAIAKKSNGRIPYFAMSDALALLPMAIQKTKPPRTVVDSIFDEFARFGVRPLQVEGM
ncbi:MAG TPA: hypothetical protein VI895_00365 [Bdellovibrionota bacterium]|nr:hypothetical protein [Bdellovibrionota bacterium]